MQLLQDMKTQLQQSHLPSRISIIWCRCQLIAYLSDCS